MCLAVLNQPFLTFGDGAQIQEMFNKHNKILEVHILMGKPVSVEKVGQQKFIQGSYAIDFAVVFLWLMVGDQTVIHIKAHDRFSVISSVLWSLNTVIKDSWEL